MAVRASAQKMFAWGSEHGTFFYGSVALVASMVGGAVAATKYVEQLKLHDEQLKMRVQELEKDLDRERERADLVVKNQLFDILHHADYEAATRLLRGSQASPAANPSTD